MKALPQEVQEDAGRISQPERRAGRARLSSERHSEGQEAAVTRCKIGNLIKYDIFFHTEGNRDLGMVCKL